MTGKVISLGQVIVDLTMNVDAVPRAGEDVFAGNVERAPEQWQNLGMEWAYRLVKEPKRIGRMAKLPLVLVKAAGRRASGRGKQRVL